jgi:Protein of unknown function (DUF3137)
MVAVLIAIVVLVVLGIAVLSYLVEKRRREAIARWAASNGWSYTAEEDGWVDVWRGDPFGEGHDREATNVLEREVGGRRAVVFDYSYKVTTGSGTARSTTTYEFSVYAQQLPAPLPDVSIEPEGLWDKAVKLFGAQDVELESVEFNDRYRVRADDPKVAYDLLNARTMEALLALHRLDLRVQDRWIVAVETGDLDVRAIPGRVDVLTGIVERVPSFVWSDRGGSTDGLGA